MLIFIVFLLWIFGNASTHACNPPKKHLLIHPQCSIPTLINDVFHTPISTRSAHNSNLCLILACPQQSPTSAGNVVCSGVFALTESPRHSPIWSERDRRTLLLLQICYLRPTHFSLRSHFWQPFGGSSYVPRLLPYARSPTLVLRPWPCILMLIHVFLPLTICSAPESLVCVACEWMRASSEPEDPLRGAKALSRYHLSWGSLALTGQSEGL